MHKIQYVITVWSDVDNTSIAEEDAQDLADILYEDANMYGEGTDITFTVDRVYDMPDYLSDEEDDYELDADYVVITDEDGV